MPDSAGSITAFFQDLRAGDARAADALFARFFPRLVGVAKKTLAGRPLPNADAEDAAQSAFVSFWKTAGAGGFAEVCGRNELWSLLAAITARKALRQRRREAAAKRGGGRTRNEADLGEHAAALAELAAAAPPEAMDLCCEELLAPLDDEQRTIALLRLAGFRNREIAERLSCTERKIERKLALVRLRWSASEDS